MLNSPAFCSREWTILNTTTEWKSTDGASELRVRELSRLHHSFVHSRGGIERASRTCPLFHHCYIEHLLHSHNFLEFLGNKDASWICNWWKTPQEQLHPTPRPPFSTWQPGAGWNYNEKLIWISQTLEMDHLNWSTISTEVRKSNEDMFDHKLMSVSSIFRSHVIL